MNKTIEYTESFLQSTSLDYDMDIEDVRIIAEYFPCEFYDKLEEFIIRGAHQ